MSRRRLEVGIDIDSVPFIKIARARTQFVYLFGEVRTWNSYNVTTAQTRISPDRRFIELYGVSGPEPPLPYWGVLLGEAINSARSALDRLAWSLAHLDGNTPKNPRNVYFPIVTEEAKWKSTEKILHSIPAEILERIRQLQPFNSPPLDSNSGWHSLTGLQHLDNWSKHSLGLTPGFGFDAIHLNGSWNIEGEQVSQAGWEYALRVSEMSVEDTVAKFTMGMLFTKESTVLPAKVYISPTLDVNGYHMDLYHLYGWLIQTAERVIEFVLSGEDPADFNEVPGSATPDTDLPNPFGP